MTKQEQWDEMSKKVDKFVDGLDYPVDAGIKETVIVFNLLGLDTDASCEGHIEPNRIQGPYIDIEDISLAKDFDAIYNNEPSTEVFKKARDKVDIQLAKFQKRLLDYLEEFYINRKVSETSRLIIIVFNWVRIQNQGSDVLKISEDKEKLLKEFQKEMNDFTEFLKAKWLNL